jgi:ParB-like nuclease domain
MNLQQQQVKLLTIKLSDIQYDDDVYPRERFQEPRVTELREILHTKGRLDPIVLCKIEGNTKYTDVDGRHRIELYLREGVRQVEALYLGVMTKQEAIKEAYERNSTGPLGFSRSDRMVAARKMLNLGINVREVHMLTSLADEVLRNLANTTWMPDGESVQRVPAALTKLDKAGIERLQVSMHDLKAHKKEVKSLPKRFHPKAAMRHLNTLIQMDWLQYKQDREVMKLALDLYMKLGAIVTYQEESAN